MILVYKGVFVVVATYREGLKIGWEMAESHGERQERGGSETEEVQRD